MTDAPSVDPHKRLALELANNQGGEPAKVVERAHIYHSFLTGKIAALIVDTAATTAPKAAAATTAPKAAAAPKTGAAAGAAPKGDTKDPKGNNTYDDVVAALQAVMRSVKDDNM